MFLLSVPAPNKPFKKGLSSPVQIMSQVKRLTLGNVFDTVIGIENITKDVCDSHPDDYVYRLTLLSAKNEKSYVDGNLDEIYKAVQVTVEDLRTPEITSIALGNWVLKGMQEGILECDALDDLDWSEILSELGEGAEQVGIDLDLASEYVEAELAKVKMSFLADLKVKMVFLDQNAVEEFSSVKSIVDYFSQTKNRQLPDATYMTNDKIHVTNSAAAHNEIRRLLAEIFSISPDKAAKGKAKKVDKAEATQRLQDAFSYSLNYIRRII